jgi:glutaminyl-tRNA synthetase
MSELDREVRPKHFIQQIIEQDLQDQKHTSIRTRFPPEPNGYLHIGHAKSICLNFGLAATYHGECHLRFDDTNPEKEDLSFVSSIQEDVQWLGFQWDGSVRYASNYFEQLHQYAVELIEKGLAYVCFLNAEETRAYRGSLTEPGRSSPYRDTAVADNLALFEQMRQGQFSEGHCVLRAKIDMASSFMCMRDPVLYRIRFAEHHQTKDTWCIYPMYDFTHCISDAIEQITHSLCSLEFQDNRRLYDWILQNISIPAKPHQYEFSRLNLEYTLMSKRKLSELVANKWVDGWDDPRMPTIAGLRRRGYTPEAVRDFCQRIGVTKQENCVQMNVLEACIRDDLNVNSPRAMAVLDPVKVVLENFTGEVESLSAPCHPDTPAMGQRSLPFAKTLWIDRADFKEEANKKYKRLVLGKEVRLRNAYVIQATRVDKDADGHITCIYAQYDPATLGCAPTDGRKVKGVIHWVSAEHAQPAEFRVYDRLFKVSQPDASTLAESLNPDSLIVKQGYVEPSLVNATVAKAYQFEREGYFCLDKQGHSEQLIFNRTVALRESWID